MSLVWLPVIYIVFFAVIMLTTVLLAVWTYKDAKLRGMDAAMWTLLIIFIPYHIGLIAYLVSRRKNKACICPRCQNHVREEQGICASCGLQFKRQCSQCGLICEDIWQNCPRCGAPIPNLEFPYVKPQEKKTHYVRNVVTFFVINVVTTVVFMATFISLMIANTDEFENFQYAMPINNQQSYSQTYDIGI